MRGTKAKALRRFAARMGAAGGLPQVKYGVIAHRKKVLVDAVTPAEIEEAAGRDSNKVVRVVEYFQIVMQDCVRGLYRHAKRHYRRQSW